jgi:O-antigen ligase
VSYLERPQPRIDLLAKVVLVMAVFSLPLSTALTNVSFALLVVLWLLAGGWRQRLRIAFRHPLSWASLALYLLFVLGASWSAAPGADITHQLGAYRKLLYVPLVLSLLDSEVWVERGLKAVYLALALTLLLVVVDAIHPLPFSRSTRELGLDNPFLTGNHYIFKHHITQNVLLSFFVLMNFVVALKATSTWLRGAALACAALACFAIAYLAQGRTGYLTLAAVIVIGITMTARHRAALPAAIAAALIAVAAAALSPSLESRVSKVYEQLLLFRSGQQLKSAEGIRLEFWRISLQMISEKPLLGWGTGGYNAEYQRRATEAKLTWVSAGTYNPHNQYLYIGTQLGIVGMLAYLTWLGVALASARSLEPAGQWTAVGLVSILAIHSMFDSPIFIVTEGHFYCTLMALLWFQADKASRRASTPPAVDVTQ